MIALHLLVDQVRLRRTGDCSGIHPALETPGYVGSPYETHSGTSLEFRPDLGLTHFSALLHSRASRSARAKKL